LFGFEDAVVDNLFSVLQARWHRYKCIILNVKLVVKNCNDKGKKELRPGMYHVHVSICAFKSVVFNLFVQPPPYKNLLKNRLFSFG